MLVTWKESMSIKIMSLVFTMTLPPSEKVVALALADHAHDDGCEARPGVTSLSEKCTLSERQVQRVIKILVEKKVLEVQRGATSKTPVCYRFVVDENDVLHRGDNLSPNRVTPMSPESSKSSIDTKISNTREAIALRVYGTYPRKEGRIKALRVISSCLKAGATVDDLLRAVENYSVTIIDSETRFVKLCATFFGPDQFWREYLAATSTRSKAPAPADDWIEERERDHAKSVAMPTDIKASLKKLRANL